MRCMMQDATQQTFDPLQNVGFTCYMFDDSATCRSKPMFRRANMLVQGLETTETEMCGSLQPRSRGHATLVCHE